MSNDFTRYPFGDKTIRVRYDAQEKKYWFVIEDVMCTIFSNGKKYWAELKKEIMAAGMTSPNAFVTSGSKQGAIDVADYKQMLHIISFVPNRKAKKARIAFWLQNHIEKDKKAENVTVVHYKQKKVTTKIETNEYEQKKEDTKGTIGCLVGLASVFIAYFCYLAGLYDFVTLLFIIIACMYGFIFYAKIIEEPRNITKSYYTVSRTNSHDIPKSIIREINYILKKRLLTFDERENFIKEAVKNGTPEWKINDFLDIELRQWIRLHPKKTVTRCIKCNNAFPEEIEQCPFCGRMDIWPEINHLTALALSDRVLTDLERQTIVNKAIKCGISSEEINQYLDDQLNLRLKSYTKVELRDCPFCGAQIPLISDDCMYCGQSLEHIKGETNAEFNISGYEADIIRSENQRVEQERHGIKNCPDCGAPFPLISNICSSCGHVLHEHDENALNIKNLLGNMQRSIDRVNLASKPKAIQIIGYWFYYILLLFSVFGFIVGIIAENEAGKLISLIGFVFGVALMATNAVLSDTKSPVLIADGEYYKARHSYEMFARGVDTLYGDNKEAQDMLSKFSYTLKQLKQQRYKNRIRVDSFILITAIAILCCISYFGSNAGKEEKPHPVINIKTKDYWALNFSKTLKPFPSVNGVETKLRDYMIVFEDAELTFVLAADSDNEYHWKVNKVALKGINAQTWGFENILKKPIDIVLLDSTYNRIYTLRPNIVSKHPYLSYSDIMNHSSKTYYADFWSKKQTSSDSLLKIIAQKAEYYQINSQAINEYDFGR